MLKHSVSLLLSFVFFSFIWQFGSVLDLHVSESVSVYLFTSLQNVYNVSLISSIQWILLSVHLSENLLEPNFVSICTHTHFKWFYGWKNFHKTHMLFRIQCFWFWTLSFFAIKIIHIFSQLIHSNGTIRIVFLLFLNLSGSICMLVCIMYMYKYVSQCIWNESVSS